MLLPRLRLPVLTRAEKTACFALAAILGSGAALRAWERSGVRLGPVHDWESLHRLVVRARTENGAGVFPCLETAPMGEEHWPERMQDSARGKKSGSGAKRKSRSHPGKAPPPSPLDLNVAGIGWLQRLPGIGPSTARAIAASRTAEGPFHEVEELQRVKGIGPKKLAALRGLVRIGSAHD